MAGSLFWSCYFSFWQDTTMPVGRWVIRTAESVVLTLWPPGRRSGRRRSQVVRVDLDLDLLGLGDHEHAGRGGVDAALRLGDGHPLHAVHPALVLQPRPARRPAAACPGP